MSATGFVQLLDHAEQPVGQPVAATFDLAEDWVIRSRPVHIKAKIGTYVGWRTVTATASFDTVFDDGPLVITPANEAVGDSIIIEAYLTLDHIAGGVAQ